LQFLALFRAGRHFRVTEHGTQPPLGSEPLGEARQSSVNAGAGERKSALVLRLLPRSADAAGDPPPGLASFRKTRFSRRPSRATFFSDLATADRGGKAECTSEALITEPSRSER